MQGQILGVDGLVLNVKGITWGGFDSSTFLDDLNVVRCRHAWNAVHPRGHRAESCRQLSTAQPKPQNSMLLGSLPAI